MKEAHAEDESVGDVNRRLSELFSILPRSLGLCDQKDLGLICLLWPCGSCRLGDLRMSSNVVWRFLSVRAPFKNLPNCNKGAFCS